MNFATNNFYNLQKVSLKKIPQTVCLRDLVGRKLVGGNTLCSIYNLFGFIFEVFFHVNC